MTAPQPGLAEKQGGQPEPFQISATTSLQERQPSTLKQGDTFGVFDSHGDVVAGPGSPEGLYHRDTRHLSQIELLVGGARPMLLSSTLRDDNLSLTCDLTNPDLKLPQGDGQGGTLDHDLVHIRRTKLLWDGACFERILVRNFTDDPVRLSLTLRFAADFVDLFEVRGTPRERRGTRHQPKLLDGERVLLSYTGLDDTLRTTELRFDPRPARLEPHEAEFMLDLPPGGRRLIFVEVRCGEGRPDDQPDGRAGGGERFLEAVHKARRALRRIAGAAAAIETSNEVFDEALRRSAADLYMLVTRTPEGPYPYAGIPWFSAPFGRDALITALLMLWSDPSLARGVLSYLAANQATRTDPEADAEPGKILHEVRHGEMAELGEVPFRRYYGSVDSTPLFVMLAGAYLARTGDAETLRSLWPHIEAALGWMDGPGDRDGDGFIEYGRMTGKGLQNQGWKDSHDSIFHADGRLAEGPITLVEVQAYAYAAKRSAARIARRLGMEARANALKAEARELRRRFEEAFWCEELGTYALALDGHKRPCRVRASNAGHALLGGIAEPSRAARVAHLLLGSTFFSGWGVRTLAAGEARYNPMSYHDGSVWPHDNALIAIGLGRYGMRHEAARILEGLFEASTYIELRRLPELFCGFPRRRGQGPTFYPVACIPQAWAAAAPFGLLQACLGIGFDPQSRSVVFDRPVLPAFLDRVVLRGISLGDASLDVMFRRVEGGVAMAVLSRRGDIRATMTS